MIWYGAGPRAGISLISVSRALAFIYGEESVRWHHVKEMIKPVFRHRINITSTAVKDHYDVDHFIDHVVKRYEERNAQMVRGME